MNGICQNPDYCACEIGWEGVNCDTCLTLPGCQQGTCTNVFECNCDENWSGAYCDIGKCKFFFKNHISNYITSYYYQSSISLFKNNL